MDIGTWMSRWDTFKTTDAYEWVGIAIFATTGVLLTFSMFILKQVLYVW